MPHAMDDQPISLVVSSISPSIGVKKKMQKAIMVMDSMGVPFDTIDLSDPGKKSVKSSLFNSNEAKRPTLGQYPQFYRGQIYIGNFEDFQEAVENDGVAEFLKVANLSQSSSVDNQIEKDEQPSVEHSDVQKSDHRAVEISQGVDEAKDESVDENESGEDNHGNEDSDEDEASVEIDSKESVDGKKEKNELNGDVGKEKVESDNEEVAEETVSKHSVHSEEDNVKEDEDVEEIDEEEEEEEEEEVEVSVSDESNIDSESEEVSQ